MFERLNSDGVVQRLTIVGGANRADLAVSPPPASAELRDKAVAPVASTQRSATEPNPLSAPAQAVVQIRDEFDKIAKVESDRKRLDAILGKLLPGYKAFLDKIESPSSFRAAEDAMAELETLQAKLSGATPPAEGPQGLGRSPSNGREAVIAKIETAFGSVRDMKGKLDDIHAGAHEALLNLGASSAGTGEITKSTQVARDLIMANARAVGVAHGRLSSDMAKLVLG